MQILAYDKEDQVALSTAPPSFPKEEECEEFQLMSETVPLNEWETYYVKCYGDRLKHAISQAPFCVKTLHENVFEINFKNYVGLSRIGKIPIEVVNKKIGKYTFDAILKYIAHNYGDLIFSFDSSPAGSAFERTGTGPEILYLKYLFIKTFLMDQTPNMDEISGLILSNPHMKLVSEPESCLIHEFCETDVSLVLQLLSTGGNLSRLGAGHPLANTPLGTKIQNRAGEWLFPQNAMKIRKCHSLDTPENRFVKHFLKDLLNTLDRLFKQMNHSPGTYLNPVIGDNIETLNQKIEWLLSHPMWTEIGALRLIPQNSTVLQRRAGYRQLFQLHALLQLITRHQLFAEDFRKLIELKDVATLFEYWCFFVIKDVLDGSLKLKSIRPIVTKTPTERTLQQGIEIRYENGCALRYNCHYSGSPGIESPDNGSGPYPTGKSYSHNLVPDMMIERDDRVKLIFDAKYKGRGSGGFYGGETDGGIWTYKDEDLDKMHTYRDAIRGVCGAFALYPGEALKFFPDHNASDIYDGVGALPLKPEGDAQPKASHLDALRTLIFHFLGLPED